MSDAQAINASEAAGGAIDPKTGTASHAHKEGERFQEGKEGAHSRLDGKDERSHANTIADAAKTEQAEKDAEAEAARHQADPTLAAREHGNEPSRGAKKDKELVDDDEEIIRKMDEAKAQSKEAHKH